MPMAPWYCTQIKGHPKTTNKSSRNSRSVSCGWDLNPIRTNLIDGETL